MYGEKDKKWIGHWSTKTQIEMKQLPIRIEKDYSSCFSPELILLLCNFLQTRIININLYRMHEKRSLEVK